MWTDKTRELMGVGLDEPITAELHARARPSRRRRPDAGKRSSAAARERRLSTANFASSGADGEVRWLSSRGRVHRRSQARRLRLIGLMGDITEQKQAVEALKDTDRRKDEFLAALAHELRNPLAPLRNALAIVQRSRAGHRRRSRRPAAMMERQLGQLVRLIDDLLDVGRMNLDRLDARAGSWSSSRRSSSRRSTACRPAADSAPA